MKICFRGVWGNLPLWDTCTCTLDFSILFQSYVFSSREDLKSYASQLLAIVTCCQAEADVLDTLQDFLSKMTDKVLYFKSFTNKQLASYVSCWSTTKSCLFYWLFIELWGSAGIYSGPRLLDWTLFKRKIWRHKFRRAKSSGRFHQTIRWVVTPL